MKHTRILVVLSVGLVGLVVPTHAHIFDFSNHTNYPLKVGVKLSFVNEVYHWAEIPPKGQHFFDWVAAGYPMQALEKYSTQSKLERKTEGLDVWKAGFCLQEIQVQTPIFEPIKTIDDDGNTIITYQPKVVTPAVKARDGSIIKPATFEYDSPLNVVITWVKNEAYNEIVQAGKLFAAGLGDLAAKTASVALGGVPMPEFKLGDIAEAIGTMVKYSVCRDRHFDIIEDASFSTDTYKSFKFLVEGRG